jgi:hypothetical protein
MAAADIPGRTRAHTVEGAANHLQVDAGAAARGHLAQADPGAAGATAQELPRGGGAGHARGRGEPMVVRGQMLLEGAQDGLNEAVAPVGDGSPHQEENNP